MHEVQLLLQETVVRGAVNLGVEAAVGAGQCQRIAQQRAVLLDHGAEQADLLGRGMARRQSAASPSSSVRTT